MAATLPLTDFRWVRLLVLGLGKPKGTPQAGTQISEPGAGGWTARPRPQPETGRLVFGDDSPPGCGSFSELVPLVDEKETKGKSQPIWVCPTATTTMVS